MTEINSALNGSPYQSYLYSYPHKTSYRVFDAPIPLQTVWAEEERSNLFLYLHVPFCEMRCGFCNLFTTAKPKGGQQGSLVKDFLDALEMQSDAFKEALPDASFSRMAIGGGTPTYLDPDDLRRLFAIASHTFGIDLQQIPCSVETSPETASLERLEVLHAHHVNRISIGVQSFVDSEVRSIGRAQTKQQVVETLSQIRKVGFETLNIDLIYGLPGQDNESWLHSIEQALHFSPEEVYLYPLYVRPLTGVSKLRRSWDDERLTLYRLGRDSLVSKGYEQISMRMFRKAGASSIPSPVYCCQADGMVGLGPGARSYTKHLHYSSEYAVAAKGVREIISNYNSRSFEAMSHVAYGTPLDRSEQKRRFVLLSLLHIAGLPIASYKEQFGTTPYEDFAELGALVDGNLASEDSGVLSLTPEGLERADAVGPFLQSEAVNTRMREYDLR